MVTSRITTPFEPLASTDLDALKLAYQAGVLDGEGCIFIARQTYPERSRRRPSYRLRVTVSQNHLRTLLHFQGDVGVEGRIYEARRTLKQNRDHYQLTFDGAPAAEVIRRLQPYLRRKRHEADLALEYVETCDISKRFGAKGAPPDLWRRRASFYKKLRALK